jgi:site-specific recombinase XerC
LRVRYEASRTGWSEGAGARLDADPAAEAETLLGARSGYEVALRDSALAEQLRTSGVELTEAEFRETYRVLATLSAGPSADAFGSAREALRSLLGSDRFDRVWAGRDAVFAVVAPLLRRQGIAEATVLAAYSVMNRSQDELVQATRLNAIDPARAIELAREVAAREEARLGSLIGAELARRVLTARAQAFLERSPVASLDSSPSQGESP